MGTNLPNPFPVGKRSGGEILDQISGFRGKVSRVRVRHTDILVFLQPRNGYPLDFINDVWGESKRKSTEIPLLVSPKIPDFKVKGTLNSFSQGPLPIQLSSQQGPFPIQLSSQKRVSRPLRIIFLVPATIRAWPLWILLQRGEGLWCVLYGSE